MRMVLEEDQAAIESDPDKEDMEGMAVDDERGYHQSIYREYNEGGRYNEKYLQHCEEVGCLLK